MPIITQNLLNNDYVFAIAKGVILLFLIFYAIFSLIVIRQVDLMGKTLMTHLSPIVKAISIINEGLAVGLIVLAWGIL